MSRTQTEVVTVLGRRYVLAITGPIPPGRYEARVWEGRWRLPWRRPYLRAPIKGRDADEARERALYVLQTHTGLDLFRRLAEDVVRAHAPGTALEVTEDSRSVTLRLRGDYALDTPLAISREAVLGPSADRAALRSAIRAHLRVHARPSAR